MTRLVLKAPVSETDHELRALIDQLANDLCRSVDGDFDFYIDILSEDPLFQKLRMLVNSTLDSARQGIASIQADKERAENEQRLIAQRDKAQAAAQARTDFLANMSHEIRTPMHGIMGMCELLLDTQLSDTQEKLLTTLLESARGLLRILNDILDMSKLEAGRVQMERVAFKLQEVVESVHDLKAVQANKKQLGFEVRMDPRVDHLFGDPYRLRQVLINLLGNAIKFTPSGHIHLEVSLHPQALPDLVAMQPALSHALQACEKGWLCVSVSDTGIGMDAQAQQQLFQKFAQLDASITRRFGGTGLGLAITREVVVLMGGTIEVTSQLGQGSTFKVWLPYHPANEVSPKHSASLMGTTVLVADASAANRQNTRAFLERHGAQVMEADHAQMVADVVRQYVSHAERLDLIIMDADMPGGDAMSVMAQLEALDTSGLPPLLLALDDDQTQTHWPELVSGVIFKPFDRGQLMLEIQRILNRRAVLISPTPPHAAASTKPVTSKLRVLMAEDNPINRMTASGMVQTAVQNWVMVEDGQQALDALSAQPFDLVLMDIQMPRMSGLEAIARLREPGSVFRDLPVVALTANAMVTDRDRFLSAGFSDHLSKPFRRADLLALIDKWSQRLAQTEHIADPHLEAPLPTPITLAAETSTADIPTFDALQFQDNFSVFSEEEQIEMLIETRAQLLQEREKIHRHMALHEFDLAERAAHKLAGGMGAMSMLALSVSAKQLMVSLQTPDSPEHRLADLRTFEQHAKMVLDLLEHPQTLLAEARQPDPSTT
jgi:two-component system sensor histidine kinase/response regulator